MLDMEHLLSNMRFLHTSDLQIGKTFGFVDDETLAILRAERLEVILLQSRASADSGYIGLDI